MPNAEIISAQFGRYTWDTARLRRAELLYVRGEGRVIASIMRSAPIERSRMNAWLLASEIASSFALEGVSLPRHDILDSLGGELGLPETSIRTHGLLGDTARAFVALSSRLNLQPTVHDLRLWRTLLSNERTVSRDSIPDQITTLFYSLLDGPTFTSEASITRAGIAYLCFDSLFTSRPHDRCLLRGLVWRLLAVDSANSIFLGLSTILLKYKNAYIVEHKRVLEGHDITQWLLWLGTKVLEAQREQLREIEFRQFSIRRVAEVDSMLNLRQKKMLKFMLDEGAGILKTGIKAQHYRRVTGASIATATRDLASLEKLGVLVRKGAFKWARYTYDAPIDIIREVSIEDIAS